MSDTITLAPALTLPMPGDDLPVQVSPPDRFYLLVCGGRDFEDQAVVDHHLDRYLAAHPALRIIHGAAPGADRLAGDWAKRRGVKCREFPANWDPTGTGVTDKSAGTKRNRKMAAFLLAMAKQGHQVRVLAMPGGRGTEHMMKYAKKQGLPVGRVRL